MSQIYKSSTGGGGGTTTIENINVQTGISPVVTANNTITFNGAVVAAGTNPVRTDGTAPATMALEVQTAQAIASTDATKIGLAAFNSADFTVDANGFVSASGTGLAETITGQSGGALSPTAGNWNIFGAATAAGTSPVVTSGSVSTLTVDVQTSQAIAATDATKIGLSAFDSARFSVDANGFVTSNGTGIGETITGQSGGALSPTAGNWNISGASTAAGTSPVVTSGSGSTLTVDVQKAQAIAATDATKIGLAAFDSAKFTCDANGFVSLASGVGNVSITGDTGGALTGNAFTFTGGSSGLSFGGAGSTETLSGVLKLANGGTNANLTASNGGIFYSSATAGAILAGTATATQMLQSGSSTTPAWSSSTWPATTTANEILYSSASNTVAGLSTANNGVLITSNAGVPSLLPNSGTAGFVLTANTGAPPSWQAASGGSGITTIDGDTGSVTGSTVSVVAGTSTLNCGSSVSFTCSGTTSTLNVTDNHENVIIGLNAGIAGITAAECTGIGWECLSALTNGGTNTAVGAQALHDVTTGSSNVGIGSFALQTLVSGTFNVSLGASAGSNASGGHNTFIGGNAAASIVNGGYNVLCGYNVGSNYTGSESSNIIISSPGVASENNIIRIGTQGTSTQQQNKCYIAGIEGATYSAASPKPALTYCDTSDGQLVATLAVASATATSAFGSFSSTFPSTIQNTTKYAMLVNVSVVVTSATSATINMGIGSTSSPTENIIVTTFSTATTQTYSFCGFVPAGYYMVVDSTGTIVIGSVTTQACAVG